MNNIFYEYFSNLCESLKLKNYQDMVRTANSIETKLNNEYYDKELKKMHIVGSVGRKTAINNCSDLDLLYVLPKDVYTRFDNYEDNGQSQLLQEIKNVLKEKYPNTDIVGDGQVVQIDFDKYTVELVPAFEHDDGSFKYPDTHDGGSWKTTKPIIEQATAGVEDLKSNHNYFNICQLIRCWKNNWGFNFKGLLIDTLVYNVFVDNNHFYSYDYNDYLKLLMKVFEYIKNLDRDQKYWHALGSNQEIYNDDNGLFILKAEKAYDKLTSNKPSEDILNELFNSDNKSKENSKAYHKYRYTEQFIDDLFKVDIKYSLSLECEVSAEGIRTMLLDKYLSNYKYLRKSRKLLFRIISTNCPKPYDIYWKVRNVGKVAEDRDEIRGQIVKGGVTKDENSKFYGPHYVECYLIKNKVCVAKKRIDVPIGDK